MTHADQPPADPNGLRRRALWVISLVSALYGVQFGMLVPLVPLYLLSLGYNIALLGAVISAQGAFQFLLPLFAGAVSDRFGARVVPRAGLVALPVSPLVLVPSGACAAPRRVVDWVRRLWTVFRQSSTSPSSGPAKSTFPEPVQRTSRVASSVKLKRG